MHAKSKHLKIAKLIVGLRYVHVCETDWSDPQKAIIGMALWAIKKTLKLSKTQLISCKALGNVTLEKANQVHHVSGNTLQKYCTKEKQKENVPEPVEILKCNDMQGV